MRPGTGRLTAASRLNCMGLKPSSTVGEEGFLVPYFFSFGNETHNSTHRDTVRGGKQSIPRRIILKFIKHKPLLSYYATGRKHENRQ